MERTFVELPEVNRTLFKIKKMKWIRVIGYPIVNTIRIFRLFFYQYSKDAKKIRPFHMKYKGERCFIIGNGPSLTASDLERLKNEHCFAANKIYHMFNQTEWRPEFYFCVDSFVLNDCKDQIQALDLPYIFIQLEGKKHHLNNPDIIYINNYLPFLVSRYKRVKGLKVSKDVSHHFVGGESVTFNSIQMAIYMGFKEIYLFGVDHDYSKKIDSKGRVTVNPKVKDYFGGIKTESYNVQTFETVNAAYRAAEQYCKNTGVRIFNATRGGKLDLFERVDYDSLFAERASLVVKKTQKASKELCV